MAVPNIFGTATAAIPLSQLDQNFATAITLGNTAVYLGNTTTSLGNVTLTNVTISSGNVTVTGANISGTANVSTLVVTGNQTSLGNVAITGNISANIVTVAAGTAALPAITTTGDTNTGIFFPAADTIAFTEGGAEAMRIDSSGNVGIGTSSPAYKLDVSAASGNVYAQVKRASQTTGEVGVHLNGGTSGVTWDIYQAGSSNLLRFYVDGASAGDKMVIDASGNVGIGVTPSNANGGVLQLKSGITFPATQVAATDANTLDDYEEGTWTPAEATISLSTAVGHYTKVGNMVTALAYMVWPTTADTNNVVINGLPFTIANTEDNRSCFITQCNAALLLSGTGSVMGIPNSTQSQLFKADNNRATNVNMTAASLRATWVYYV